MAGVLGAALLLTAAAMLYKALAVKKQPPRSPASHGALPPEGAHTALGRPGGGVVLPASSSPHVVPLPMSDAQAVDPEELFVAALSSCHMLWFLSLARDAGFVVDRYEDEAEGQMARDAQRRMMMSQVTLRPRVQFAPGHAPSREQLQALHHAAHEQCYIANSVRTQVRCELRD
jgi:organic hydroperoxide reductase OsmC/OhrA